MVIPSEELVISSPIYNGIQKGYFFSVFVIGELYGGVIVVYPIHKIPLVLGSPWEQIRNISSMNLSHIFGFLAVVSKKLDSK